MIKLQLNKNKIISLIKIVRGIVDHITAERAQLQYSLKRAEISAHMFILQEMDRKLRSKYILIEHKPDHCRFFFSVNEMQAYILMLYKDAQISATGYDVGTMQELSIPIFKKLLN